MSKTGWIILSVCLCVELWIFSRRLAALVEEKEVARLPIRQQAVYFLHLHSFGQLERCVFDIVFKVVLLLSH